MPDWHGDHPVPDRDEADPHLAGIQRFPVKSLDPETRERATLVATGASPATANGPSSTAPGPSHTTPIRPTSPGAATTSTARKPTPSTVSGRSSSPVTRADPRWHSVGERPTRTPAVSFRSTSADRIEKEETATQSSCEWS